MAEGPRPAVYSIPAHRSFADAMPAEEWDALGPDEEGRGDRKSVV